MVERLGKSQREKEPRHVSSVAVYDDRGRLLVMKRADNGCYTLPGGRAEPGESSLLCAVRELYEETGLRPIGNLQRIGRETVKDGRVTVTAYVGLVSGKPTAEFDPDEEAESYEWVNVSNGLPKRILENLHSKRNVVLKLLGLQNWNDLEKTEGGQRGDPYEIEAGQRVTINHTHETDKFENGELVRHEMRPARIVDVHTDHVAPHKVHAVTVLDEVDGRHRTYARLYDHALAADGSGVEKWAHWPEVVATGNQEPSPRFHRQWATWANNIHTHHVERLTAYAHAQYPEDADFMKLAEVNHDWMDKLAQVGRRRDVHPMSQIQELQTHPWMQWMREKIPEAFAGGIDHVELANDVGGRNWFPGARRTRSYRMGEVNTPTFAGLSSSLEHRDPTFGDDPTQQMVKSELRKDEFHPPDDDISRLLQHANVKEAMLALKMEGVTPEHLKLVLQQRLYASAAKPLLDSMAFHTSVNAMEWARAVFNHPAFDKSVAMHIASDPGFGWLWGQRAGEHGFPNLRNFAETVGKPPIIDDDVLNRALDTAETQPSLIGEASSLVGYSYRALKSETATRAAAQMWDEVNQGCPHMSERKARGHLLDLADAPVLGGSSEIADSVMLACLSRPAWSFDNDGFGSSSTSMAANILQHRCSGAVAEQFARHEHLSTLLQGAALRNERLARESPKFVDDFIREQTALANRAIAARRQRETDPETHFPKGTGNAELLLQSMAKNPGLTSAHVHALVPLAVESPTVRSGLMESPALQHEHLQKLISSVKATSFSGQLQDWTRALARSPQFTPEMMHHFMDTQPAEAVNEMLRAHKVQSKVGLPSTVLDRVLQHSDHDVRLWGLKDGNVSVAQRARLFHDPEGRLAYEAASRMPADALQQDKDLWNKVPEGQTQTLAQLALSSPHQSVQGFGVREAAPEHLRSHLLSPTLLANHAQIAATREDLPPDLLNRLADHIGHRIMLPEVPDADPMGEAPAGWGTAYTAVGEHSDLKDAATNLVTNPSTPIETIERLVHHPVLGRRLVGDVLNLKGSRALGAEALTRFASSGEFAPRQVAAGSPRTPPSVLRQLWRDLRDPQVSAGGRSIDDLAALKKWRNDMDLVARHHVNLLKNPNLPEDVLEEAARVAGPEHGNPIDADEVIDHPNTGLSALEYLAQNKRLTIEDRRKAKERMTLHNPDRHYKEHVLVRIGKGAVGKLRRARDFILAQAPETKQLHPKAFDRMPGDYSVGRLPNGNISADALQQHIDSLPATRWNVSHETWDGPQRHSDEDSKVFQLNISNEHVQKLKAAGVWGTFLAMHDATRKSTHPVGLHTIGWVRYTGKSTKDKAPKRTMGDYRREMNRAMGTMYKRVTVPSPESAEAVQHVQGFSNVLSLPSEDAAVPTPELEKEILAHPFIAAIRAHAPDAFSFPKPPEGMPGYFVDEVQSDFGQSFVKQAQGQMRDRAMQQAMDRGMNPEQARAHVEAEVGRAGAVAEERFPDADYKKVSEILFQGRHPNEVISEGFMQWLRDKGKHKALVQWHTPDSKAPLANMKLKNADGSARPLPGHMHVTYDKVPKGLGFVPSEYGRLQTQTNRQMKPQEDTLVDENGTPRPIGAPPLPKPGAPTFEGLVRKSEQDDAAAKKAKEAADEAAYEARQNGNEDALAIGQKVTITKTHYDRDNPWSVPWTFHGPGTITALHSHPDHGVIAADVRDELDDEGVEHHFERHIPSGTWSVHRPEPKSHVLFEMSHEPYEGNGFNKGEWLVDALALVKFEDEVAGWLKKNEDEELEHRRRRGDADAIDIGRQVSLSSWTCRTCGGHGVVSNRHSPNASDIPNDCSACGGTGHWPTSVPGNHSIGRVYRVNVGDDGQVYSVHVQDELSGELREFARLAFRTQVRGDKPLVSYAWRSVHSGTLCGGNTDCLHRGGQHPEPNETKTAMAKLHERCNSLVDRRQPFMLQHASRTVRKHNVHLGYDELSWESPKVSNKDVGDADPMRKSESLFKAYFTREQLTRYSWRSPYALAMEAAEFLTGGVIADRLIHQRARWHHDGDPIATALAAHNLPVTKETRASVEAIQKLSQGPKKGWQDQPASDLVDVQNVEPARPEAAEVASAVERAYAAGDVEPVSLGGKHSAGTALARDAQTAQTWLLKPGSGPPSPAAGIQETSAGQSAREACFYQVAKAWGLEDDFPEAALLLLDGQKVAAIHWLPPAEWEQFEKTREESPSATQRIMEPYRQRGRLHQWAVLDFVLGQIDRHFGNVMVDESDHVKLIDEGSSFAGAHFDPAHDESTFVPCYLRLTVPATTNFNKLSVSNKLRGMPHAGTEGRAVLRSWVDGLDPAMLTTLLQAYGIDPQPSVRRLERVKALAGDIDLAVNRLWVTT